MATLWATELLRTKRECTAPNAGRLLEKFAVATVMGSEKGNLCHQGDADVGTKVGRSGKRQSM